MDPWRSSWTVQWPRHFTVQVEGTLEKVSKYLSALLSYVIKVYRATESPRSVGTYVHRELTVIKSRYGSSEVIMVSSMASAFYSAKRWGRWMNSWEKVSKSFSALLSCMIKISMDSFNMKFVIDSTLRVSTITNFHNWTRPWIYNSWTLPMLSSL